MRRYKREQDGIDGYSERYARSHTLFYLDPPYWQAEGYGVPFGIEEYEQMADISVA